MNRDEGGGHYRAWPGQNIGKVRCGRDPAVVFPAACSPKHGHLRRRTKSKSLPIAKGTKVTDQMLCLVCGKKEGKVRSLWKQKER